MFVFRDDIIRAYRIGKWTMIKYQIGILELKLGTSILGGSDILVIPTAVSPSRLPFLKLVESWAIFYSPLAS